MVALGQHLTVVQPETVDDYPYYAKEEIKADATAHLLGILGALAAFAWLASQSMIGFAGALPLSLTIYALCMITLFCCSAAYHMTPKPQWRPVLRRFDQSAIFFKIAGTYTPLVVLIDTTLSYSLLAMVWGAALLGAGFKLGTGDRLDKYTVVIYLGISWSAVLLLWSLFTTLPLLSASLIVVGGVVYTVGVYFHQSGHIKYNNAIWHFFVLGGSACHFLAIANAI
ncbi:MAG: hemolysin III family protein [Ahrensia sp.]